MPGRYSLEIWGPPSDPAVIEAIPSSQCPDGGIVRPLIASKLDDQDPDWSAQVQSLRAVLGAPHNHNLLPPQFIFATLREIGGDVLQWHSGSQLMAAGLRLTALKAGSRQHLICYHLSPAGQATGLTQADLLPPSSRLLPDNPVQLYDGAGKHAWADPAVLETVDGITYGRPSVSDAGEVRQLQSSIWQAEDIYLYPNYLHDPAFGAVRSLVARREDHVVGFLLGFLHHGPSGLLPPIITPSPGTIILESLILGVHPDYRTQQIAFHLKRIQAAQTREMGIQYIQWVVDPLQYRNARLNLGRLGAASGQFLRDYLPFRNALNQVHASRVRLIWPLNSMAVRQALQSTQRPVLNLENMPHVGVVNEGLDHVRLDLSQDWLAVEIPDNWEHMQSTNLALAQQWRNMTDEVLDHYLGSGEGQYLLTHTGHRKGKVYLMLERVRSEVVNRYRLFQA